MNIIRYHVHLLSIFSFAETLFVVTIAMYKMSAIEIIHVRSSYFISYPTYGNNDTEHGELRFWDMTGHKFRKDWSHGDLCYIWSGTSLLPILYVII